MLKSGAFLVTRLIGVPPEKVCTLAHESESVARRGQSSEACDMRKNPSPTLTTAASPPRASIGRRALRAVAGVLLAALGCGGGSSGFATMGMPGIPSPTRVGANLVFADVAVNGYTGGRLGVDTGSPVMLVDQSAFPGLMLGTATEVHANVTAGQFTVDNVPLVQQTFGGGMDPLGFAGLFGGEVMRQFTVRLDYANPTLAFRLGRPSMEPAVDGVEVPGAAIGFTLQGGGRGQLDGTIISFPATRIPLTVDIEGVSHPFIMDTGASETTVRSSVYAALT